MGLYLFLYTWQGGFLIFLTPASASPFPCGLYGEASSCLMLLSAHHFLNGPMNGGQPRMLNHVSRTFMTDWVEVEFNLLYRGNPDHLSTQIICFLPAKSKRSSPTWAMGAPKAADGDSVVRGLCC